MNLITYINKKVQIVLSNGFTYIGFVVGADDDSITIIDKTNSRVCLKETAIDFLKEVSNES